MLARYHGARRIDTVDLNPQMVDLVRARFADFAGRLYDQLGVRIYTAEARGFVARIRTRYDLINVVLLDSFAASSAELYAVSESTLYTVEALATYVRRLASGGILAITRLLKLPPRDSLKMFATAVRALERLDVEAPGRRLVVVRSWNTVTLMVKNGEFTSHDVDLIEEFVEARGFDRAHHPGIEAADTNRNNVRYRPYLYEAATDGADGLRAALPRKWLRKWLKMPSLAVWRRSASNNSNRIRGKIRNSLV